MKFTDINLRPEIQEALAGMGFTDATEIQEASIPLLLQSRTDLLGMARTGTGKTGAFGIPLVQQIDTDLRTTQALVLSPTRELCLQIAGELEAFSAKRRGLRIATVYGGASIGEQIRDLERGAHIIVATPGRLADLIRRRRVDLAGITDLVLDEADSMLQMGFKEELDQILAQTPADKRVVLFSATMPAEVERIARTHMRDPHIVRIANPAGFESTIEHLYCMVHSHHKFAALKRILDSDPGMYSIIFCRTKAGAQQIADWLRRDGYQSLALHGDLSQAQREDVMAAFRRREVTILAATDVAARGLDVDNLSHVIHFDLPDEAEAYTHRSGRTGRAGRKGLSISIINMKEVQKVKRLARAAGMNMGTMKVPGGREICEKQLIHLIDRVHNVDVNRDQIAGYLPLIEEKLAALDRDELLTRFVSFEFNRFLQAYDGAEDLNPVVRDSDNYGGSRSRTSYGGGFERGGAGRGFDGGRDYRDSRDSRDSRGGFGRHDGAGSRRAPGFGPASVPGGRRAAASIESEDGFVKIKINVGRKDRIMPQQVIGLVNDSAGRRDIRIGKIEIGTGSSFVMVAAQHGRTLVGKLNGHQWRGRPVQAELFTKPGTGRAV